jgi:hypothetical protein
MRFLAAPVLVVSVTVLASAPNAPSGQPTVLQVFFGNLHSHTAYSDGTGTPQEAYDHARTAGQLDFLLISEHNHAAAEGTGIDPQGLHIANDHSLYNGPQTDGLITTASRVNTQFAGEFVALYGQEYSTNSDGNHVNVYDIDAVIDTAIVPNKDFRRLYDFFLVQHPDSFGLPPIVQFNHPANFNEDYGVLNFGTIAATLAAAAPYARTIEIINGPHNATTGGHRVETIKSQSYLRYLNAGFRISPTADQDNHFITHGTATDHRTGVWAPALTKRDLMDAIRARRTYASQDRNLVVRFLLNDAPMGSVLTATPGQSLTITVDVSDPDEPSATYRVSLRRDVVGGDVIADSELAGDDLTGDGTVTFNQFQYTGGDEYFLVQIVQTGTDGADQVWTAPVWLTPETNDPHPVDPGETPAPPQPHGEEFVWSVNSSVFHLATCRVIAQIAPQNRKSGHTPPDDRRLHTGCPQ